MPAFSALPLADLVPAARALYVGAHDTPEIAAALQDYGYAAADFEAGLDLVEDVEAAAGTQAAEYAEQYAATERAGTAAAAVEATFARHRRLARLAHARGTDGYRGLGLAGRVPDAADGLLAAADAFYRALEERPALAEGVRTLTPAAVAEARAHIADARRTATEQTKETGEAQRATRLRDDAVVALRAHAAELAAVAKLALGDRPQLREALGLTERGS